MFPLKEDDPRSCSFGSPRCTPLFPILHEATPISEASYLVRKREASVSGRSAMLESPMALPWNRAAVEGPSLRWKCTRNIVRRKISWETERSAARKGCERKSRPGWDGIWIIESSRSWGRTLNKITWQNVGIKSDERKKRVVEWLVGYLIFSWSPEIRSFLSVSSRHNESPLNNGFWLLGLRLLSEVRFSFWSSVFASRNIHR